MRRAESIIALGMALAAGLNDDLRKPIAYNDRKPRPYKNAKLAPKVWKKKKANKRAQNQARNRQHH